MNTSLPVGNRPMPLAFKLWKAFASYWPIFPVSKIIKLGTHTTPQDEFLHGYEAPFPSRKYKAGARAWPGLVPSDPSDKGVRQLKRARQVLSEWTKPALIMFSDKDPITKGADRWFRKNIPSAKDEPEIVIRNAGHFLQEDKGRTIAEHIHVFIQKSLGNLIEPEPVEEEE